MTKHLFVFTHDVQIDWYKAFADAFRRRGPGHRAVLFVHGPDDVRRGKATGCFDVVVDVLEGFSAPEEGLRSPAIAVDPEIVRLERDAGTSFFWDDVRVDRWARDRSPAYIVAYLNHAFSIVRNAYTTYEPVASVGECTMALYRLGYRLFLRDGKPWLSPIATRYFTRHYWETSLSWDWQACQDLYREYLRTGVPIEVDAIVRPLYEGIVSGGGKPIAFVQHQRTFGAGYTQLRRLPARTIVRKVVQAFRPGPDAGERRRNLRSAAFEKGPLEKIRRIVRERVGHAAYDGMARDRTDDIRFATYFLHYQPEYTVDALGRFYADQVSLIHNIAAALPAGMHLVVKEHPAMVGLRPPSFYRRIQANTNVRLVHHAIDSRELIRQSEIVFTIVGTAALEAMFIGRPAIMFGQYAFANTNLISYCDSYWRLPGMIQERLAESPTDEDVRRHAMALLAAKFQTSRAGLLPLSAEAIDAWDQDRGNYGLVMASFIEELTARGILQ